MRESLQRDGLNGEKAARSERRSLLPRWASAFLTAVISLAALSSVLLLVQQNRELKRIISAQAAGQGSVRISVGDSITPLTLTSRSREGVSIMDVLPNGGVAAFFTSTCEFCTLTLPVWGELRLDLQAVGIGFIGVSLDSDARTDAYLQVHDIRWPVWNVVTMDEIKALKIDTVPITVLFSAAGEAEAIWFGALDIERGEEVRRRALEDRGG